MQIGRNKNLQTSIDVAITYQQLAEDNRKSAELLFNHSLYNEAAYFYIQTMEKVIKEEICKTIDVTNPYFSDKLRNIGHSLDLSVSFLIEILSGNNELLRNQLTEQLVTGVLKNLNYSKLHNNLRYPKYNSFNKTYTQVEITKEDCITLKNISINLENYVNELYRI